MEKWTGLNLRRIRFLVLKSRLTGYNRLNQIFQVRALQASSYFQFP